MGTDAVHPSPAPTSGLASPEEPFPDLVGSEQVQMAKTLDAAIWPVFVVCLLLLMTEGNALLQIGHTFIAQEWNDGPVSKLRSLQAILADPLVVWIPRVLSVVAAVLAMRLAARSLRHYRGLRREFERATGMPVRVGLRAVREAMRAEKERDRIERAPSMRGQWPDAKIDRELGSLKGYLATGFKGHGWQLPVSSPAGSEGSPFGWEPATHISREEEGRAFAAAIRAERRAKGWTQDQMVTKTGLTVKTISRAEGTGLVNGASRQAICRALGLALPSAAVVPDVLPVLTGPYWARAAAAARHVLRVAHQAITRLDAATVAPGKVGFGVEGGTICALLVLVVVICMPGASQMRHCEIESDLVWDAGLFAAVCQGAVTKRVLAYMAFAFTPLVGGLVGAFVTATVWCMRGQRLSVDCLKSAIVPTAAGVIVGFGLYQATIGARLEADQARWTLIYKAAEVISTASEDEHGWAGDRDNDAFRWGVMSRAIPLFYAKAGLVPPPWSRDKEAFLRREAEIDARYQGQPGFVPWRRRVEEAWRRCDEEKAAGKTGDGRCTY